MSKLVLSPSRVKPNTASTLAKSVNISMKIPLESSLFLDLLTLVTTNQLKQSPNFSMNMKRKLDLMYLFMSTVLLELYSVLLPLQASNSDSKSLVLNLLMRIFPLSLFCLPKLICRSGHKYGLVYPGVGWIVWRDQKELPEHLKFELHYLGGTEETYTLNFSRPGAHVVAQYYNFIHLGFEGYAAVQRQSLANARFISTALEATGCISLL